MKRRESLSVDPIARRNRRAAMSRWYAFGSAIPHDTPDLRLAIKREIWSRGLSIFHVERKLGFSQGYLSTLLSVDHPERKQPRRIQPNVLKLLAEHLHITPKVLRRLHILAARAQGWDV